MSTSAERLLRNGTVATLRPLPYDHPVAHDLVERVQEEYVQRYGGRDAAGVDAAEFLPPLGIFLVAEGDGEPAGCGAWRGFLPGGAGGKRGGGGARLPPPGAAAGGAGGRGGGGGPPG